MEPVTLPIVRSSPFDPPAELDRLREASPLLRLAYPNGQVGWLVTGHTLARQILQDRRFGQSLMPVHADANDMDEVFQPPKPGHFIMMDPPEHTLYRRLLASEFTIRKLSELRPQIESLVQNQLDTIARAGSPADLVPSFAWPIPTMVISRLLGIPSSSADTFRRNTEVLVEKGATKEELTTAWETLTDLIRGVARHKRRKPEDDLISRLVASGELTDEELGNAGALLLAAGHETTSVMLSLGVFALLTYPNQWMALASDLSLVDNAVEELLRYLTIFQFGIGRKALEDVQLEGSLVRAGEHLTISLPAANRDPEVYDNPNELDVTRDASRQLAFAHGIHICLGQHLARIEMQVAYSALLRRFPNLSLAVAPEDIPLRTSHSDGLGVESLPVEW